MVEEKKNEAYEVVYYQDTKRNRSVPYKGGKKQKIILTSKVTGHMKNGVKVYLDTSGKNGAMWRQVT